MNVKHNTNSTDAHTEWIPETTTYVNGMIGPMGDRWDEQAMKMFPCNCQKLEHGHHFHDCQSQYAADVADALRQAAADATQAERERCAKVAEQYAHDHIAAAIRGG